MGDAINVHHQMLGELVQHHFNENVSGHRVLHGYMTMTANGGNHFAGRQENPSELFLNAFAFNHLLDTFLNIVFLTGKGVNCIPLHIRHNINLFP